MTYRPLKNEAEAAETWCPFVGTSADQRYQSLHGVPPAGPAPTTCVGSRCMVWMWHGGTLEKVQGVSHADKKQYSEEDGWSWNPGREFSNGWFERPLGDRRQGYCGRIVSP